MKRWIALLILLLLPSLPACSAGKPQEKALTLGALPSIDVLPIVIAEQQRFFEKYGVKIKLELFQSAKDRDAAFQAGALDGMFCDEVAVSIYRNAGTDLKITGLSCGEYVLVAGKGSGVGDMGGLKDRSIAISENTLIEYVLDTLLMKNGMKGSDVKKLAVPAVPVRLEMLGAGRADAALLPEPYAQMAVAAGGTALASATGDGLYPSVIAFPSSVIDAKRREIAAFWQAYDDATDYINRHPVTEYEDLIIKNVGYPESMKGKIALPKFGKQELPGEAELRAVILWASAKNLCKNALNPADMIAKVR